MKNHGVIEESSNSLDFLLFG